MLLCFGCLFLQVCCCVVDFVLIVLADYLGLLIVLADR